MDPAKAKQNVRDAVLVHGLALLAAGITIILAIFLRPSDEAFAPAFGVSLTATCVILAWSLTLALRGCLGGAGSSLGCAVLALGGLEIPSIILGYKFFEFCIEVSRQLAAHQYIMYYRSYHGDDIIGWSSRNGAIFYLPPALIAYLAAVSVTRWRACRAAKLDAATGIHNRRYWKRGLVWFCSVFLVVSALLAPIPLFLYATESDPLNGSLFDPYFNNGVCFTCIGEEDPWVLFTEDFVRHPFTRGPFKKTWQRSVLENTPVFVGEAAACLASLSSHPAAKQMYQRTLLSGRVSRKRLLAESLSTDDSTVKCTMAGLERNYAGSALELAVSLAQSPTAQTKRPELAWAGRIFGQFGRPEQIRYYLNQAATQSPAQGESFVNGLIGGLGKRKDVLPDLIAFCKTHSPWRTNALMELAWMLPEEDLPRVWAEWSVDDDPLRRWDAIEALACSPHVNARFTVLARYLESPHAAAACPRREPFALYLKSVVFDGSDHADRALLNRLVQDLLPLLSNSDRGSRIWTAFGLERLLCPQEKDLGQVRRYYFQLCATPQISNDAPAEPEELELLEKLRARAKSRLENPK